MRLRLTRPATRQLDRALSYVEQYNPQGARKVQQCLQDVMRMLLQHPFAGRATDRPGIRRIVASPYPYVLTYRVSDAEIIIRSVRHTSRRSIS
ncbi:MULTISPECIES: type II toxin-antitoxin system RelE/ParE family toxin [Methylobacterium]|uniref:type II toxin-antitoxin system RelE/ParE family toxin n=1 Tax=Methylobacterium TaxID=407 RepID=UPI0011C931D3|nr:MULTISPECIES: type II toxin-antitoxin system RelE/ParE family toxin [Methylobacterium]TXN22949.1 type II toxin-antitoxin system RelE/ParE family toxin [Methylobacterium sp. WL9]